MGGRGANMMTCKASIRLCSTKHCGFFPRFLLLEYPNIYRLAPFLDHAPDISKFVPLVVAHSTLSRLEKLS